MITAHVEKLEQRFSRLTACHVVLKGPGAHHRQGRICVPFVEAVGERGPQGSTVKQRLRG
jgi:hypothetical protein